MSNHWSPRESSTVIRYHPAWSEIRFGVVHHRPFVSYMGAKDHSIWLGGHEKKMVHKMVHKMMQRTA